jgi:hypothetical protein
MRRARAAAGGAERCESCGLHIKWGQGRTILDGSADPPRSLLVCPVCAIERGQWPAEPREGSP